MRILAAASLVAIGGGGLLGGVLLLIQPDGSALGMSLDMLPPWYRGDYTWAGAILVLAFGFCPLAGAVLLFIRPAVGWLGVLLLGSGLLVWMGVQIAMIGLILPPMQLLFVVVGVVLAVAGAVNAHRAAALSRSEHASPSG